MHLMRIHSRYIEDTKFNNVIIKFKCQNRRIRAQILPPQSANLLQPLLRERVSFL